MSCWKMTLHCKRRLQGGLSNAQKLVPLKDKTYKVDIVCQNKVL